MAAALEAAVHDMIGDPELRVHTWTKAWYQDTAMKITGNTLYIRELLECSPAAVEMVLHLLSRFPGMHVCVCSEHFQHACMLNVARLFALECPRLTLVHKLPSGRRMQATCPPTPGDGDCMQLHWRPMPA